MILGLSTPGQNTQIWLLPSGANSKDKSIKMLDWESGRELADLLLSKLRDEARLIDKQITDIEAIVIFSGPGSFTSLRIGHTVANTLADSLNIPIVGSLGDDWLDSGLKKLRDTKPGVPVWPFYGAEANITRPKT